MPKRNRYYRNREWRIDKECPPPGGMLNQPTAKDRSNGGGDRGKARPRANRPTAAFLVKRGADNRETAGHQKRCANPLNASRDNELINTQGDAAGRRSYSENRYADDEDQAAAKQISKRTSN